MARKVAEQERHQGLTNLTWASFLISISIRIGEGLRCLKTNMKRCLLCSYVPMTLFFTYQVYLQFFFVFCAT